MFRKLTLSHQGLEVASGDFLLTRHGAQSTSTTVSGLLLPRVLLFLFIKSGAVAKCRSSSRCLFEILTEDLQIAVQILQLLYDLHKEVEEDAMMVAPSQMALLMVDWTDPQKAMLVLAPHRRM